jgi:hypothetical protein
VLLICYILVEKNIFHHVYMLEADVVIIIMGIELTYICIYIDVLHILYKCIPNISPHKNDTPHENPLRPSYEQILGMGDA